MTVSVTQYPVLFQPALVAMKKKGWRSTDDCFSDTISCAVSACPGGDEEEGTGGHPSAGVQQAARGEQPGAVQRADHRGQGGDRAAGEGHQGQGRGAGVSQAGQSRVLLLWDFFSVI